MTAKLLSENISYRWRILQVISHAVERVGAAICYFIYFCLHLFSRKFMFERILLCALKKIAQAVFFQRVAGLSCASGRGNPVRTCPSYLRIIDSAVKWINYMGHSIVFQRKQLLNFTLYCIADVSAKWRTQTWTLLDCNETFPGSIIGFVGHRNGESKTDICGEIIVCGTLWALMMKKIKCSFFHFNC